MPIHALHIVLSYVLYKKKRKHVATSTVNELVLNSYSAAI